MSTTQRDTHRERIRNVANEFRANGIRILLVVVGIQGITPDLNDLASSLAFRLLLPMSTASGRERDACGGQGVVGRPAESEWVADVRQRIVRSLTTGCDWIVTGLDAGRLATLRSPGARGRCIPAGPPTDRLCRLTC